MSDETLRKTERFLNPYPEVGDVWQHVPRTPVNWPEDYSGLVEILRVDHGVYPASQNTLWVEMWTIRTPHNKDGKQLFTINYFLDRFHLVTPHD